MSTTRLNRERAFTQGTIWKQMLGFLIPIMLGSFVQQLYNIVDSIVVGQYLGVTALAAVGGSTSTITTLLINFFAGLSAGASVVIAQDFGAGGGQQQSDSIQSSMLLGLLGGLLLMLVGELCAGPVLRWMRVQEEVFPLASQYLRIYMAGMLPIALYNMGAAVLNAVGDSKSSFVFLTVACVTNIALDLLFVGVFHWGIGGAAAATCLAQLLSSGLIVAALARRRLLVFRPLLAHWRTLRRIVRIGMPGGLQSMLYSVANMVVQWAINQLPLSSVAACSIYERIESLFWTLMMALGVAVTTFAGQNYGAGLLDRMRKSVRAAMGIGAGMAAAICAVCLIFAQSISRFFTSDPATIADTMTLIYLLMPFCITYVATEVLGGAIKGCGEALRPMIITLLCTCGLRILWVVGVSLFSAMDIRLLMACYPVSWSVSSLVFLAYYRKGRWLKLQS